MVSIFYGKFGGFEKRLELSRAFDINVKKNNGFIEILYASYLLPEIWRLLDLRGRS